ncbi:MAG: hypothetical protein U1F36_15000 [Planctomycetota bacterium]
MKRLCTALILALQGSCSLPTLVDAIDAQNPRSDLDRPAWVRAPATAGTWICGAAGAVASLPFLIVSWPIEQLSGDHKGRLDDEWLFAPTSMAAGAGHFLFGAPFDFLDYGFRRAWIDDPAAPLPARPEAQPPEPEGSASGGR